MDRPDLAILAQQSVIGSMLIDERCVPMVFQKLRPEDFTEPTCRTICRAIHEVFLEGKVPDPVAVVGAIKGGDSYVPWMRQAMEATPTAANVGEYIGQVREASMMYRFRNLCMKGIECLDTTEAAELSRKMSLVLSSSDRMPRMTGPELSANFWERMNSKDKPKYLPWGIPTADRATYAELGDMILLGGYSSSGKTLLSVLMAMAQAKAGYKVGYYSLETRPEKMADRIFASVAKVPLDKIKTRDFSEDEWKRFADAMCRVATEFPFDIIQASGFTVDDVITDAIGHGYQVVYVDYVQLLTVAGIRADNPRIVVTEVSQRLKRFAQSTKTAVVGLAQFSRPEEVVVGKGDNKKKVIVPPDMHSFKESGQLEQDADVAFLVWPSDAKDNWSSRLFKIGKNKEGERHTVELAFYGKTQTMVELASKQKFEEAPKGVGDNPFAD